MKRISRFIAIAAVALSAASAQSLEQRIAAIVSRPEYLHARFGMEFWPLDADKPAYHFNEQQFFIAASTTKLLTEGTALSLLGPEYRFHTRVFRTVSSPTGLSPFKTRIMPMIRCPAARSWFPAIRWRLSARLRRRLPRPAFGE
jgi:hypothetical protein